MQPHQPRPMEGEDEPSKTLSSGLAAMNQPPGTDGGAVGPRNPHSLPGQAELCLGRLSSAWDRPGKTGTHRDRWGRVGDREVSNGGRVDEGHAGIH